MTGRNVTRTTQNNILFLTRATAANKPKRNTHQRMAYAAPGTNGWSFDPYAYRYSAEKTMDQIRNQIERLQSLKKGKSFKGFCGLYVDFQLRAIGIFPPNSSYLGHGNTWYNGVGPQQISRNYSLKKYPGTNCLEDIVRANGNYVYNIAVCFSRGRFGHVLFIHAIINGRIFFTDSFAFNNIDERKMHILSITAFKNRYQSHGHRFIGALHFKKMN